MGPSLSCVQGVGRSGSGVSGSPSPWFLPIRPGMQGWGKGCVENGSWFQLHQCLSLMWGPGSPPSSLPPAPLALPGFLLHLPQTPPLPAAGPLMGTGGFMAPFSTHGQTGGRPCRLDQVPPQPLPRGGNYQENPHPSRPLLSSPESSGICDSLEPKPSSAS